LQLRPIEVNDEGGLVCEFSKDTRSMHSHLVDMYVTGDLAFQAMALGSSARPRGNNSWMSRARCGQWMSWLAVG
jgi:hypothetical protein